MRINITEYNELAIAAQFNSKVGILEILLDTAIVGTFDDAMKDASVRGKILANEALRQIIMCLKTAVPEKVLRFSGLAKWSALWWSAVLQIRRSDNQAHYIGLVGWHNNHSTKAAAITWSQNLATVIEKMRQRITEKEEKGYRETFTADPIELDAAEEMPPISTPVEPAPAVYMPTAAPVSVRFVAATEPAHLHHTAQNPPPAQQPAPPPRINPAATTPPPTGATTLSEIRARRKANGLGW